MYNLLRFIEENLLLILLGAFILHHIVNLDSIENMQGSSGKRGQSSGRGQSKGGQSGKQGKFSCECKRVLEDGTEAPCECTIVKKDDGLVVQHKLNKGRLRTRLRKN